MIRMQGKRTLVRLLLSGTLLLPILPTGLAYAASSVPPAPSAIRVDNKLAPSVDTVVVSGLSPGDVVKVYADGGAAAPLGTATVSSGSTSATVSVNQLGALGGHIYVTLTQPSYSESRRIVKSFPAEPISTAPAATSIRVSNQAGGSGDQVTVLGLHTGDQVKVYSDSTKRTMLGSGTVSRATTDGTVISVSPLDSAGGVIFVTVTEQGKRESRPTEKAYEGEAVSAKPLISQINVVNELGGSSDRVIVSGLKPGDTVKVYESDRSATPLAQKTVAPGSTVADVPVAIPSTDAGKQSLYVSVTSPLLRESGRVAKQYRLEPVTSAVAPGTIVVTNEEAGTEDRIEVIGLQYGDVVKVYGSPTDSLVIGSASVGADSSRAVIRISQLGREAGYVYVTVTSQGKTESGRTMKVYAAEQASAAPSREDIRVNNGVGANDTVTVTGLQPGDLVKVYADETASGAIGSAVAANGSTSAVVSTALPSSGYGIVYVTVTRALEEESARTPKIYNAEPVTLPVSANLIRVVNSTDTSGSDEVSVLGLQAGDTVKIYWDATSLTPMQTLLGTDAVATVSEGSSVATISRLPLKSAGGTLYVTVTSIERRESGRTLKVYEAE
ncbi:hypothetical protein [Paenibacillus sp. H1-7]|uniref:hypothetical protein n=1 Tax=Paenibacillus sp. H1-7 TaxID=2282849 RepID=UPI001EF99761|nr:hypothetical protein [Paenibacillus sp. H1-7]